MKAIPKESFVKSVINFLQDGYSYMQNTCHRNNSDIFQIKLPGKIIICISGKDAAALFYDASKFKRGGAIPKRIQKTLFGQRAIHTLDEHAHEHRKKMFMSIMTSGNIEKLVSYIRDNWELYLNKWELEKRVVLFDEAQEIFTKAACAWAGIPLKEEEVKMRTTKFVAMVEAFGAVGPRHWRGKKARKITEEWVMTLVDETREGNIKPDPLAPLGVVSFYRDNKGELLDRQVAAVEVINLTRPIVAISYYIIFSAFALFKHPECKEKIKVNDERYLDNFINEVRRFFPFAPFLGALVKEDFHWNNYFFPKNSMVMLDVYGTNHDARIWEKPDSFYPGNFQHWDLSPFDFIPQGGGDFLNGHRCPGEWITIEAMKASLIFLIQKINYDVPEQDLNYNLRRFPTFPKSRFIIENISSIKEV